MTSNLRDKLLLFQTRTQKNPEAFGKIYDAYVSRIYRFIYFKVSSVQEAEDLTSETFLKLWQYLQDGKPVRHLGALTYQVARNLVTDYYRSKPQRIAASTEEIVSGEQVGAQVHADIAITDRSFEKTVATAAIERALRLLKDEYREVVILRYLDELAPREIATVLGKSSGATRVLIHRALEALRTVLKD